MNEPSVSIVIPCFNEEESLEFLFSAITNSFSESTISDFRLEVIIVDDGSSDGSWDAIQRLSGHDPRFRGIRLSRNFGHQPAVSAGLVEANGELVGVIDADLQDPPHVLFQMFDAVVRGDADIAVGVRKNRKEPPWLRFFYSLFYRLIRSSSRYPWVLDAGDFCVLRRQVVEEINRLPEKVRMLRGLRAWVGFRQLEFPYDRPARIAGESKYSLSRLVGLAATAFVGFSTLPLRVATLFGLFMGMASMAVGVLLLANRLLPNWEPFGYSISENPGTATISLLLTGMASIAFLCLGTIGEYIGVLMEEVKGRPTVIICERTK